MADLDRRNFLKTGGMVGVAGAVGVGTLAATAAPAAALPSDWSNWMQKRVNRDGETVVLHDDYTTRSAPILLKRPVKLESYTKIIGSGKGVTTVRPHPDYDPSDGPMFQTKSNSGDGEHHIHIEGVTIDGDGRVEGMDLYAFLYTLRDIEIKNCPGHGFRSESFTGGASGFAENEGIIENLDVFLCGSASKAPMVFDGPHDTKMARVRIATQDWTGPLRPAALVVGAKGHGTTIDALHLWGRSHTKGLDVADGATGCRFPNIYAEGAREEQVYLRGANQNSVVNGRLQGFTDFAPNAVGIRLAGATNSGHLIDVQTVNCQGGGVVFEGGSGAFSVLNVTSWNSPLIGTPHATTHLTRTAGGE